MGFDLKVLHFEQLQPDLCSCFVLCIDRRVAVLTDAGSMPAIVALGTVGDAVITQQPRPRHLTPQTNTADACLQVCCAALTV